jgi:hypothetical protein
MAQDPAQVRVALAGNVWVADTGSTVPADITVAPNGSWTDLGYCTDDGVTVSIEQSTQDIPGWQSMDPLRIIVTAEPKSFSFTLRQLAKINWTTTFGGTVTTLGANNYKWTPATSGTQTQKMWLIEFLDGSYKYRMVFRNCQQQGARELTLNRNDAVNLPLEYRVLAALPEAWHLQTNDTAFA